MTADARRVGSRSWSTPRSFASSTTRWGRSGCPAWARWGAQTQRATENFPVSGHTLERRLVRALALIKAEAARVNAAARRGRPRGGRGHRRRRRGGGRGHVGRALPRRRVPDRVGHLVEHEHQRGPGRPGRRAAGRPGPPQRPGQRQPVLQRRVPQRHPPGRRRGGGRRPDPRRRAPRGGPRGQGRRVRPGGQVGSDPPDGRHPGDAGPGVRRVRLPAGRDASSGYGTRCPGWAGCRSAAPPWAPG